MVPRRGAARRPGTVLRRPVGQQARTVLRQPAAWRPGTVLRRPVARRLVAQRPGTVLRRPAAWRPVPTAWAAVATASLPAPGRAAPAPIPQWAGWRAPPSRSTEIQSARDDDRMQSRWAALAERRRRCGANSR